MALSPELPDKAPSKPRAFITLDALRGLAALAVVCVHIGVHVTPRPPFPHGFLAVDFFFMLSGFVMTYVYQDRLDRGWSGGSFLRARILRLYPLYGLGVVLGAVGNLLGVQLLGGFVPRLTFAAIFACSLLFLPTPPTGLPASGPNAPLYYFDFPGWSLFYELVANLAHALLLRRRSLKWLVFFTAACGAVLLVAAVHFGTIDFGNMRASYRSAVFRVLYSYSIGILAYRLWSSGRGRFRFSPLITAVLLVAVLMLPLLSALNGLMELAIVSVLFPGLLLAGASNQPPERLLGLSRWLGALSYPLYILHIPLFQLFQFVEMELLRRGIVHRLSFSGFVFLFLLLPIATWFGELYDPEARKLLQRCVERPRRTRLRQLEVK